MASDPQQKQSSSLSSAPPSPLVWFQIYDSASGKPYKGTTPDYVCLLPGSVIAQFRDAVKKKENYDRDAAVLSPFKSSQLLVYKNKAAFDKRNVPSDEVKEEPLEEDSFIDGLGASKQEALIVAVLSPTSYLKLGQLEQEIKALENSENFKTLASKREPCLGCSATDRTGKGGVATLEGKAC